MPAASPAQLARVRAYAEEIVGPLPDVSWQHGARLFSRHAYKKEEYLLRAGDVGDHIYYVLRGLLRQFYTTDEGKEFNKSFSVENEPCGSFRSSLTATPSRFAIQALEPTEVLAVRFSELTALFETDVHWERLGRKSAEYQTLLNEEREAEFLLDSAAVRYRRFQEQYPGLEARIPQYHVASYLGITSVALSRIRGKLGSS